MADAEEGSLNDLMLDLSACHPTVPLRTAKTR
jgi:hypothetical protein